MPSTRPKGVVAKWLNHKGIGFITPSGAEEGENNDVLVHYTEIKQESEDGFKSLKEGSEVEYDLKEDPKDATKFVAVFVTGPEGGDCEPKPKGKGRGKGKGKRKGSGKSKPRAQEAA
jgi:cold shock CspA family protein